MKLAAFASLPAVVTLLTIPAAFGQTPAPAEAPIRDIIKTFAELRNAHDGRGVAALYSEDGEWRAARGLRVVRGRPELAALWSSLTGTVERSVEHIEIVSDDLAVVRVATVYDAPTIGKQHEVFVLVHEILGWRIRIHKTL